MLKRFISYYKPHKLMFAADMLASLFISLIGTHSINAHKLIRYCAVISNYFLKTYKWFLIG